MMNPSPKWADGEREAVAREIAGELYLAAIMFPMNKEALIRNAERISQVLGAAPEWLEENRDWILGAQPPAAPKPP